MRPSVLLFAALVALSSTASAAPPAHSAAGGLPACRADQAAAEAEIDALTAELDAAHDEIDALTAENEALRAAALPSPFELDDVLARIPLGGGDTFDREALGALAKVFGAVAAAAEALDLAGAVLTVDDTGIALHMLGRDRGLNLRSGGTMSLEPGGSYSVKVPKIILNP